jgi:hypothetical protein
MQRPLAAASAALVCLLGITTSASAETRLERAYSANYHAVAKKHGARAPGRDIRKLGVRYVWHSLDGTRKHWATRPARRADLARSLRQLKRLLHPFTSASPPRQPPAGVLTPRTGYAIPAYIVDCESGGDPQAVNVHNPDRPAGIYQMTTDTWLGYGGGQFAPTADLATPSQQGIIAARLWADRGSTPWACA